MDIHNPTMPGGQKMEKRHRRTKREKLEDELLKTEEAIEQYTAAISTMQERRQELLEQIEAEHIKEVTKLLKEKNLSVEQLKSLLGGVTSEDMMEQGA